MADRPILFSAPMIRAILEGRKSQTRRIITHEWRHGFVSRRRFDRASGNGDFVCHSDVYSETEGRPVWFYSWANGRWLDVAFCPGDRLWVRENFRALTHYDHLPPREIPPGSDLQYQASEGISPWVSKLRPAMFMPRWASRITLIVEAVRVERLQEISEADALAEGVTLEENDPPDTARAAFYRLWESINGPGAWDTNPWVTAITFRPIFANIDSPEARDG